MNFQELKDEIAGVVKEIVKRYLHRDLSISHVKHDNLEIRGEKPEKSDKRGFLSQAAPSTPSKGSSHGTSYLAAGDEEEENTTELISTKEKVNLSSFEILKVLGRGAFGKVVQVRKKDTDSLYAMKILKKKFIYENQQVEHTMAERSILAAFENPFIMNLRYAFQTKDKLYLVMDLYKGGELYHHLEKLKRFSEPAARIIIAEIAIAIGHLHSLHFIYRDLKPENVLMDNSGHVCLTDFGLAKRVEPDEPFSNTFVGTPQYIAPEILRSQPHGKAVDWWSLGIMLYELVVGIPPFYSPNLNEMFERIQSAPLRFPRDLSSEIMDLISRLLVRDPSTRLGSGESDIEEIISHPFFRSIDWEKLFSKEITPPYQPQVRESWIDGGPRPDLDLDLNSFVEGGNTLKNAGDTDKFLDFTFVSENTLRKKK